MDYFKELSTLKDIQTFLDWFLKSQGFCVICEYDNPLDLEADHIGARANSPVTVSLCRNCHGRKSTIQRKSWPKGWYYKNNPKPIKNALVIRGLSDLLRIKSDRILEANHD